MSPQRSTLPRARMIWGPWTQSLDMNQEVGQPALPAVRAPHVEPRMGGVMVGMNGGLAHYWQWGAGSAVEVPIERSRIGF